jgi:hypothetical protein
VTLGGAQVAVRRSVSPDGRYVRKAIQAPGGRRFTERVRLFEPDEIAAMLADAGVAIRHRLGDYDGSPLRADSPRTILVGQAG